MGPKKKEQQKMSLGAFLHEEKYGGSWADEVEEVVGSQPLPPSTVDRKAYSGYSTYGSGSNDRGGDRGDRGDRGGYSTRDTSSFPTQLPTKPPYTAHLGNLSYEASSESVSDFFSDCEISNVRIIEDRIEQRPKGFAYAEFHTLEGLKKALTLDGESFQGRTIKVRIADPPKDRDGGRGDMARELVSWERKGPLADAPSRNNDRRPNDFSERRAPSFRDAPSDDGKVRDFGNWERRGPLSPLPQPERSMSRTDSRPRGSDAGRGESFRQDRKVSATWGEGRQEGSRPPREFKDRPERPERPERSERPAPSAAELDNKWRKDTPVKSPEESREGSEAPSSPAPGPAVPATGGRPRLQLTKRTVSEAPDASSSGAGGDAKASPFGAARPIDTAAKEREIADKRDQLLKDKKDADDKAKEELLRAKEAAAKEAAEKAVADAEKAAADAEAAEVAKAEKAVADAEAAEAAKVAKAEKLTEKADAPAESKEAPTENAEKGTSGDQKLPTGPKESAPIPKSRAVESGNWRTSSSSGEQRGGRGGYVNAPRGRGDARGRGAPRGPRGDREPRGPRPNGNPAAATAPGAQQPTQAASAGPEAEAETTPAQDPDGWTTVPAKTAKGRRPGRV